MSASRTVRAYVGLGANVGDAARTLATAIEALEAMPGIRVRGISRLYATVPWGVTDQPDFRNAVAALDVRTRERVASAAALDLLGRLKTIERRAGRRPRRRWGPRELDLDLLVFGRHRIDIERSAAGRSIDADDDPAKAAKRLQVPHRDLGERLFVLAPLADVAPRLVPPGWTEAVGSRRRRVASSEPPGSVRAIGEWDPAQGAWRPSPTSSGAAGAGPPCRRPR